MIIVEQSVHSRIESESYVFRINLQCENTGRKKNNLCELTKIVRTHGTKVKIM
jgi:hypothetical protein